MFMSKLVGRWNGWNEESAILQIQDNGTFALGDPYVGASLKGSWKAGRFTNTISFEGKNYRYKLYNAVRFTMNYVILDLRCKDGSCFDREWYMQKR